MKAIWFALAYCVGQLNAAELGPMIQGFGLSEKIAIEGRVRFHSPQLPPGRVSFQTIAFETKDALKMEAMVKWLKSIPAKDLGERFHGIGPMASTPEILVLQLSDKGGVHHEVSILGRSMVIVDHDVGFNTNDTIDWEPLLQIVKRGEKDAKPLGKNQNGTKDGKKPAEESVKSGQPEK